MTGRFDNVKGSAAALTAAAGGPKAKVSKKTTHRVIQGWYPPDMAETLKILCVRERTTTQALLGEALDQLMKSRGMQPFGYR